MADTSNQGMIDSLLSELEGLNIDESVFDEGSANTDESIDIDFPDEPTDDVDGISDEAVDTGIEPESDDSGSDDVDETVEDDQSDD